MFEHNVLGCSPGLVLCLTKVRSSRARCLGVELLGCLHLMGVFMLLGLGSNPQFLEHFSVNLARSAKMDNISVQSGEQSDFSHKIIKSNV